jgi:hypothetical protein
MEILKSRNDLLKNLGTILVTTLLNFNIVNEEVKAFSEKDLKPNSSPYQSANVLKEVSGPKGDNYESLIVSVWGGGKWYSAGVKGGLLGTSGVKVSDNVFSALELQIAKANVEAEKIVVTHNHSVKVILRFAKILRVEKFSIKDENKLLSGPSSMFGDCPVASGSNVAIIVEPGGSWMCKQEEEELNTHENDKKFNELRKKLIIASQNLSGKELEDEIKSFIVESRKLIGLKIEFLPNSLTEEEFQNRVDSFF